MNAPLCKDEFESWMRQLLTKLDHQEQMILSLAGKEFKEMKLFNGERLLDNQDLCLLLQASKRSLQRYRSSGLLKYQMLRHKVYYKESDVKAFLTYSLEERGGCKLNDLR